MPHPEDLYRILGVDSEASAEEIRRAYIKKARLYHPDTMRGLASVDMNLAEQKMKEVNRAYEVLRHPERRRQYDASRDSNHSLPRPVIEGSAIRFNDVIPRRKYTAYFVVRNQGGPYTNLRISSPGSWLKIASSKPLHRGAELPMRVDIEAEGREWGKAYSDMVTVRLDGQEAQVQVELRTRAKGAQSSSTRSYSDGNGNSPARPQRSRRLEGRNTLSYGLFTYTRLGQTIGAAIGLIVSLVYVALLTFDLASAAPWPHLRIMGGLLGLAGAVSFGAIGTVCGLVVGWLVGMVAGVAEYAVRSASDR